MKELEKQLHKLQKQGYETIGIDEVLRRIRNIRSDAFIKRHRLNDEPAPNNK